MSTEAEKNLVSDEIRYSALMHLKREVKQLMEESVMKKFISEESNSVIALCIAVEACLMHCLKARVFGLFGPSSSLALLHRIATFCPPAASIMKMVIQVEQQCFKDQKRLSFDKLNESPKSLLSRKKQPANLRYLWIRLALFEKVLHTIVDYIAKHAQKYYDKGALMLDSVAGSMVPALLVGPCALEYSKAKTLDHYFSDPPADELLQRHRIHSRGAAPNALMFSTGGKSTRPTIQVRRTESLGPDDAAQKFSAFAREYVMSLHQNMNSTLLYGKNNVHVFPVGGCKPMRGYLSLHQTYDGSLIIKWMPNELVHSKSDPADADFFDTSNFWKNALCLNVRDLVYIHVHNKGANGGSIVFIGADGIQHPPIYLPPGQHPLVFISCIENSIKPWGQLDPPLWLQRGIGKIFPKLKRRTSNAGIINGLSSSSSGGGSSIEHDSSFDNDCDYVFRILPLQNLAFYGNGTINGPGTPTSITNNDNLDTTSSGGFLKFGRFSLRIKNKIRSLNSTPSTTPPMTPCTGSMLSLQMSPPSTPEHCRGPGPGSEAGDNEPLAPPLLLSQVSSPAMLQSVSTCYIDSPARTTLKKACDSMRYQILSRAFYGWLAHCKNMSTVRTHLKGLVLNDYHEFCEKAKQMAASPVGQLNEKQWSAMRSTEQVLNETTRKEFCWRVYNNGIEHGARSRVWPYLLGFYAWSDDQTMADEKLRQLGYKYESSITEWSAVEAIVRERDKEAFRIASENRGLAKIVSKLTSHDTTFDDSCACSSLGDTSSVLTDITDDRKFSATSSGSVSAVAVPNGHVTACDGGGKSRSSVDSDYASDLITMEPVFGVGTNSTKSDYEQQLPEETPESVVYSKDLIDIFAVNIHRIDKDVHRCDRNHPYFVNRDNLEKLRNIMCTYVWEHLELGYVQGMCDLAAPLLVIFNDEVLTYGCFIIIMNRLSSNFPHGKGMEANLMNFRSLLQIMDPELFELMQKNCDSTHFYFSYRWFLLDFKRELIYEDIFYVWETIWAAGSVSSTHFVLFVALAMVEVYRDILIDNDMDFTDIIKFFNEMAEHHETKAIVSLARTFVSRLQKAIE